MFFCVCVFCCCCCSHKEQESSPSIQPQTEPDETKSEPLTVIEQPEVTSPQPTATTANQAMKGTFMLHALLNLIELPT